MSAFVEASYYSFGNQNISFPGAVTTANTPFLVSSSQSVETVQFGVNYHFWTR
jgi:hypothetical protein